VFGVDLTIGSMPDSAKARDLLADGDRIVIESWRPGREPVRVERA
jgi:hypothetical protein